ncbi:MAG: phosphoribosylformylglycinamidine synthase, partial [Pirellulaceae bacterium]|nr:phosphoribosylformylglycinamidine synthase [Pirellulaceae bacterium]
MTLWEIDIYPGPEQPDLSAGSILSDAEDLGLDRPLSVATAHGYLIEGDLSAEQADQLAEQLLSDSVVERTVVAEVGDEILSTPPNGRPCLIHVMPKPGVMDPVAQSALKA